MNFVSKESMLSNLQTYKQAESILHLLFSITLVPHA